MPAVTPGTILGHEAVGTVVEIGAAVTTIAVGDRVLVSCITSCGRCRFCKEAKYGLCIGGGGWIFGHPIDGLQAEFARVRSPTPPSTRSRRRSATSRCCSSPTSCPTAYEVGVLKGGVEPGDTVAIVGAGRSGWRRS